MIFAEAEPFLTTVQWGGLIVVVAGGLAWLGALSTLTRLTEARCKRNESRLESHSEDIGKLHKIASVHETRHAVADLKIENLKAGIDR